MDPQELLARGHADMAESSAEPPDSILDDQSAPFRMTVAEVFMIKGRGTVVTGRVESGTLRVGTAVRVERDGFMIARPSIGGIEQFRKVCDQASAGENVGLFVDGLDGTVVQAGDLITT